jgi:hypothetical protein
MNHEQPHAQHNEQHSDHAAWLADCRHWQMEHSKALATLAQVEAHLKTHVSQVAEHAYVIHGHDRANVVQEALMAKAERGEGTDASADGDAFLGDVHAQQAARHAALRKHHLAVMAHVNSLAKILAS